MSTIKVQLISDRTAGGILSLYSGTGTQVGFGLSVLGKAAINTATDNGNPLCNPKLPYGDTPTGIYNFLTISDSGAQPYNDARKFGPNGVIKLDPVSGDAATAKANGRKGILIHGGDFGTGRALRRTNGCLRLANDEYASLKDQINTLSPLDPLTTIEVSESGSSSPLPCDNNSTCDEGDPPPGF